MRLKSIPRMIWVVLFLLTAAGTMHAAPPGSSMSLTPAVITARGSFGQSLTERLSINNGTSTTFNFVMEAQDIVVKNGKRAFVPAGELDGSIAATAVFSPKSIVVPPNSSGFVTVTLTIPQGTPVRAIAAIFRTQRSTAPGPGTLGLTASLGTLITFNISSDESVAAAPLVVSPATATTNLAFDDDLENTGTEPVIPKGATAILSETNQLVGKATFESQRLLPGERLTFHAEYAGQLRSGHYRAICTFDYEGKTVSQQAEFTVP